MRKPLALVVLLLAVFGGAGSSALVTRALAQPATRHATHAERRLGPKSIPRWYWSWLRWRLTTSRPGAKHGLRPRSAPHHIPRWAWRRLRRCLRDRARTSHGLSYKKAIAYTKSPPPFTPSRTIDVSSAAQLRAAIAHLQAGDLVQATSKFTVNGEVVITSRLASPAVLDLNRVSFEYDGGHNVPALYLGNPQNLRIYGGSFTTDKTGGYCINMHGGQHVLFWGFYAHDCGASGVFITPVGAPVSDNDFQGVITHAGENLAWDPCAEKGACFHGVNLWDSGTGYAFTDNRFAFSVHDQASGAAVEIGNNVAAPASGNVLYEKAVGLTFVARRQTGGNGLQLHGVSGLGLDVRYLAVDNAQGRALDSNGIHDKTSGLAAVAVEYGRASDTNRNSALNESDNRRPWDVRGGVIYKRVSPAP